MFLDGLTVGGITQVFDFCGEYGVLGLNLFALGQQRLVDGVDWFVAACCQPLIWRTQSNSLTNRVTRAVLGRHNSGA